MAVRVAPGFTCAVCGQWHDRKDFGKAGAPGEVYGQVCAYGLFTRKLRRKNKNNVCRSAQCWKQRGELEQYQGVDRKSAPPNFSPSEEPPSGE